LDAGFRCNLLYFDYNVLYMSRRVSWSTIHLYHNSFWRGKVGNDGFAMECLNCRLAYRIPHSHVRLRRRSLPGLRNERSFPSPL
jgi:hypothetical protein